MPPKAITAAANSADQKKYVVTVSVSQGKHIPFSSHVLKCSIGPDAQFGKDPASSFEMPRRGATPVYNETREIYLSAIPQHVTFMLYEAKFFGSNAPKAMFKVPIRPEWFDREGQRHRACPLSYNTLVAIDEKTGQPVVSPSVSRSGSGSFNPPAGNSEAASSPLSPGSAASTCGQLEVEVKCGLKDKGAVVQFRETLGVLSVKMSESKHLPKLSSATNRHFIEVSYGLQRYCTKGSTTAKWDDMMRLWVYEQTKEYRLDLSIIERGANETTGGKVVGRCLLSTANFADQSTKDTSKPTTVLAWCDFLPPQSATASDRDEGALKARTMDIGALDTKTPTSPRAPGAMPNVAGTGGQQMISVKAEFTFTPRQVAERMFFEGLWQHFDADKSGTLDKVEVAAMMDTLHVDMSDADIDKFVASVDADGSGQLDHNEVMNLLQSGEFQKSALSAQMMSFLLDGKEGLERMISGGASGVKMVDGRAVRTTSTGQDDKDDMGLLIFDRASGMMLHEHIPWYIKVALKSMYRSGFGLRVAQTGKVRSMLVAQSRAEGVKMDDPASKAKIAGFIEQYGLDKNEIRDPLDSFPHFNAFFYRHLKPGARPVDKVGDDAIAVSCADSRMSVFRKMTDATKVWIKGSEFTVEKLLGPRQDLAPLFTNPTLVIARLAPQDYHRVHFPVSGTVGKISEVDGTLYTVNPIAVREEVNVYTENVRHIIELKTKEFGTVVMIMVGATMVGSVNVNPQFKKEGAAFKKGDDAGYFAFGGSTTLLLFQPGSIELDSDLVDFSQKPIEMLVRVGNRIGKATGHFSDSASAAEASLDNLRSFFGKFDADGSGFLDLTEAIACVSLLFPNESVNRIIERIRAADSDNDQRMSFLEFSSIAKDVERLPAGRAQLAQRLHRYYEKYNKAALERIPEICERYDGREEELFATLIKKYGPEP